MALILRLVAGFLLLVFGRSLFWLFCAAIGFLIGAAFAARLLPGEPEVIVLVVALAVGLIGALLALVAPSAVGALAGFVAGGYLAVTLIEIVGLGVGNLTWLPFVAGGIVGAAIVLMLFDWALIGLSSLMGAVAIAAALAPRGVPAILAIGVLFVVGVIVQAGLWPSLQRRPV
jgi:hypothetical protein